MPELTFLHFLLVCPLVFTAGFIDAVAGGGGLISLPAYLLTGLPVHTAIGTNKLSSAMGTTIATFQFWRKGYINWKLAAPCIGLALTGSFAGARLALLVDDKIFKTLMLIILPLTAVYVLKSKAIESQKEPFPAGTTWLLCAASTLILGVYDGFYGPGTGTFLLLLLSGAARLSLQKAAGITKIINLTTNITALTVFLFHGVVLLPLGLTAGLFSIAGNYLGSRFFSKKGANFARPVIILVLCIFFVRLCSELFFPAN